MLMQNPERALLKLVGEVHALFIFAQVLAKTHPNPNVLIAELEIAEQYGLAGLEPYPIGEAAILTFQDTVKGIQKPWRQIPCIAVIRHDSPSP